MFYLPFASKVNRKKYRFTDSIKRLRINPTRDAFDKSIKRKMCLHARMIRYEMYNTEKIIRKKKLFK